MICFYLNECIIVYCLVCAQIVSDFFPPPLMQNRDTKRNKLWNDLYSEASQVFCRYCGRHRLPWLSCSLNPDTSINHVCDRRHPFLAAVRARFWCSAATLQEHLDWLKEQVARRDGSFPRFSPGSGARGAAHAHTASHTLTRTHTPAFARVRGATEREQRDSPERRGQDFGVFLGGCVGD